MESRHSHNFLLWENVAYWVYTPVNPHLPYYEGPQVLIEPKKDVPNAWEDPDLTSESFRLSAHICSAMEKGGFAFWFNIQANGNWGLLEGATPHFHIHIYGRNRTHTWGTPIVLPKLPRTYHNDPMPGHERNRLKKMLKSGLSSF